MKKTIAVLTVLFMMAVSVNAFATTIPLTTQPTTNTPSPSITPVTTPTSTVPTPTAPVVPVAPVVKEEKKTDKKEVKTETKLNETKLPHAGTDNVLVYGVALLSLASIVLYAKARK